MAAAKIPDADFISLFGEIGPQKLANRLGINLRSVMERRRGIEGRHGIVLTSPQRPQGMFQAQEIPGRINTEIRTGLMVAASDLHAWPGAKSTAFRSFLKFIKEEQPKTIVLNGDVIDGASISRHPSISWDKRPTLIEELEAAQECLHQIELAAPRTAELYWPAGNHDARFGTWLATHVPEFAKVHGTHLKDHFGARWQPCWSVWVNDDVVIKHRFGGGGINATYNAALKSGKTSVMGHTHSAQISPVTDYNGTRWGVNLGCLADCYGPQFGYLEDGPRNWRSAWGAFSFSGGELIMPELCIVRDQNTVEFRGERRKV